MAEIESALSLTLPEQAALVAAQKPWAPQGALNAAVTAILAARLAPIEALAAEWEVLADYVDDADSTADQRARSKAGVIAADQLRAALADPQPGASGVGSGGPGGGA